MQPLSIAFADETLNNSDSSNGVEKAQEATNELEQRQNELDRSDAPTLMGPTPLKNNASVIVQNNVSSIASFVKGESNDSSEDDGIGVGPYGLQTNLLENNWNADRDNLIFSWKNPAQHSQVSYQIDIARGSGNSRIPVYQGKVVSSSEQSSVYIDGLGQYLEDNSLYSWSVTVEYSDGSSGQSSPKEFVTSVGNAFISTDLLWTGDDSVSNLVRAHVPVKSVDISKAVVSVTALDTEGARRHVYDLYVNGTEVGVGPNRRSGNTVYYNTFDVTDQLNGTDNTIGVFNYSQAKHASGVLIQLTYFKADGSGTVVYNSGDASTETEIMKMDSIVYGTSNASIGTGYYTELAQNADTSKFPFGWQTYSDTTNWVNDQPQRRNLQSINANYTLAPSITQNTVRSQVSVQQRDISNLGNGTYTITFPKEIIGDVQLTSSKGDVRITLGEELSGGKAVYKMRTGNTYDETWKYSGDNVTFAGYSLKAFRYVTLYNYPGELTAASIKGLQTSIPESSVSLNSFKSDNSTLLNSIYGFAEYTSAASTIDTVSDSVTRERRPYEGDNLVYQNLAYATGRSGLEARNTWNYLLANPTQYTEYQLMPIIGVYQDYLHTNDLRYVSQVYGRLKSIVESGKLLQYNTSLRLVSSMSPNVDLIDWPRGETLNYDFDNTKYKTIVNIVAYAAYNDLSSLASAQGLQADAKSYSVKATAIKNAILSRLYNVSTGTFIDGLSASGSRMTHALQQNAYYALAFGVYKDQKAANTIASRITLHGRQASGSIYSAYFFYSGLYLSGNGDKASTILGRNDENDDRTYFSVINKLGATISPEAWTTSSKSNMTFSHPWGAGGGAAMVEGVGGVVPRGGVGQSPISGSYVLNATGLSDDTVATDTQTRYGSVSSTISRNGVKRRITVTVPSGMSLEIRVCGLSGSVEVQDESGSATQIDTVDGVFSSVVGAGSHRIELTDGQEHGDSQYTSSKGDSLAVRRSATYYFKNSISGGVADRVAVYGRASDTVLVGDWDGDGVDTLAVRRGNTYYFKNSISGGVADRVAVYGRASDTVLVGDWDGDGVDTLAVRRGNVYYVNNAIAGGNASRVISYGRVSDSVLVGDWNGDGADTFAVRRGANYYFKNLISGGSADGFATYGKPSDIVIVGNWDGR
ncbi:hypothetical protein BPY_17780 [Bifidobacterium psychraerophilum]